MPTWIIEDIKHGVQIACVAARPEIKIPVCPFCFDLDKGGGVMLFEGACSTCGKRIIASNELTKIDEIYSLCGGIPEVTKKVGKYRKKEKE